MEPVVARPAPDRVIARPAVGPILAVIAGELVVAGLSEETVGAAVTAERVIAGLAMKDVAVSAAPEAVVAPSAAERVFAAIAPEAVVIAIAMQYIITVAAPEAVAAVPAEGRIGAGPAGEAVTPHPAPEAVAPVAAGGRIVSVAAVEDVVPVITFDGVVAIVAGDPVVVVAPGEAVMAITAPEAVAPGIAMDAVPAVLAPEPVVAVSAANEVVSVTPAKGVVAAPAIEDVGLVRGCQAVGSSPAHEGHGRLDRRDDIGSEAGDADQREGAERRGSEALPSAAFEDENLVPEADFGAGRGRGDRQLRGAAQVRPEGQIEAVLGGIEIGDRICLAIGGHHEDVAAAAAGERVDAGSVDEHIVPGPAGKAVVAAIAGEQVSPARTVQRVAAAPPGLDLACLQRDRDAGQAWLCRARNDDMEVSVPRGQAQGCDIVERCGALVGQRRPLEKAATRQEFEERDAVVHAGGDDIGAVGDDDAVDDGCALEPGAGIIHHMVGDGQAAVAADAGHGQGACPRRGEDGVAVLSCERRGHGRGIGEAQARGIVDPGHLDRDAIGADTPADERIPGRAGGGGRDEIDGASDPDAFDVGEDGASGDVAAGRQADGGKLAVGRNLPDRDGGGPEPQPEEVVLPADGCCGHGTEFAREGCPEADAAGQFAGAVGADGPEAGRAGSGHQRMAIRRHDQPAFDTRGGQAGDGVAVDFDQRSGGGEGIDRDPAARACRRIDQRPAGAGQNVDIAHPGEPGIAQPAQNRCRSEHQIRHVRAPTHSVTGPE